MEIRNRAELDVLYPEPQKGIKDDSPELLMMKYISERNTDGAAALFRDRRQFTDDPPAVDTPYGRFEGKEQIQAFAEVLFPGSGRRGWRSCPNSRPGAAAAP